MTVWTVLLLLGIAVSIHDVTARATLEVNTDNQKLQVDELPSTPEPVRECELSEQCPADKACISHHCEDPCLTTACGNNTICHATKHIPACSCTTGFIGNPLEGCKKPVVAASWEEWWTYDGISGPEYWGRINPEWSLCNKGRRQSPINVEPHKLLFDPHLRHIEIDKHKISGTLINTGQSLVFRVDRDSKQHVNISGGPLAYRYQFEEFFFHYGIQNQHGSEHRIHGYTFPGEIQLYGFNAELYHNMSEAQHKSQGIVGISLMVQIGDINLPNPELRVITSTFNKVLYKGSSIPIRYLSLHSLLPDTSHYMTYEGSTTHPGCWETTVWIIINKPVYITKQEMYALRKLMQGSQEIPKAPLGNNARPLQPLHHRTVRTNIDFQNTDNALGKSCPVSMKKEMYYKGNPLLANQWRNVPDTQFLL